MRFLLLLSSLLVAGAVASESQAKCLKSGALCSGFAGPVGKCCSGLSCVNEGPDRSVCRGPKKANLVTQTEPELKLERRAEPLCVKKDNTCASQNGRFPACCDGLTCTFDDPKDVNHGTCRAPLCVKRGNTCATANGKFAPCCEGSTCTFDDPADPARGTCRKTPEPICVKTGNTCASVNGRYPPCCAGSTCTFDDPKDASKGTCRKNKY